MILMFKRTGCDIIRISDPTPHEIGTYLHMAAAANNTGDLELIQIVNHVKEPVKEVKVML